jgi:hypothetical protein
MQCEWCGVERDAPAMGPHTCNVHHVARIGAERERARIADLLDKWATEDVVQIGLWSSGDVKKYAARIRAEK